MEGHCQEPETYLLIKEDETGEKLHGCNKSVKPAGKL